MQQHPGDSLVPYCNGCEHHDISYDLVVFPDSVRVVISISELHFPPATSVCQAIRLAASNKGPPMDS